MKIAFIAEHFNPGRGGAETYMNDFSIFLTARGHEVHFYTQDKIDNANGIIFHYIKTSGITRKIRWMQWLSFLKQSRQQCEKEGFDIVMGAGKCSGVNVYQPHGGCVLASHRQNALLVGNRLITSLKKLSNFFSPKHIVARRIDAALYSDPKTHYIAISKMVQSHMKEFYQVDESRVHLIYNGIDTSRFSPATEKQRQSARQQLGLPQDKVVFSLVAHNFKLKGVKELIEAMVVLKKQRSDFLFAIAGNGKRQAFEQQARKSGVEQHIKFLGALDKPELVYTASDVYVQPTWYDPCSLVVLEALAAGLPTITSSFNGAGELIEQGIEGFVISRPDNTEELSSALLELFDEQKRKEMGLAARKKIAPHTLENNFNNMLKAFEQVVKSG